MVIAGETVRDLVEKVRPLVGDLLMQTSDLLFALLPPMTAFLLAGEGVLEETEFLRAAAQMFRVGDLLAVAGDKEMLQPNVQAERVVRDGSKDRFLASLLYNLYEDAGDGVWP